MKGKRKNTLRLSSSFTSTACISCLLVCIWSICLFVCLFSPSRTWLKSWILLSRQILFHQKTGPRTNRFSCVLLFIIVSVHTISIWCTTASKKKQGVFLYYYKQNSSICFIFFSYTEVEIQQLQPWRIPPLSPNESNEILPITGFKHWYPPLDFRSS